MLQQVRATVARIRELFRHRSRYALDQAEEFRFHLEMETAENIRRGMSEADAQRAALLRFGGTQRFREETSDARGVVTIDNLARDARFALRRLRRAPAFAAGVVATLGMGIGTAVGIGMIVYGVLLRELPYSNPDRLMRVGFHTDGIAATGDLHSAATFLHFAKSTRSFVELGAYSTNNAFTLTDGDAPERVTAALMTPSVFTLLGVRPILGQLFEPGDTSWSSDRRAILISEELWERRYGADSSMIGRPITLDRGERLVIGVLPRAFDFPSSAVSVYYPAAIPAGRPQIAERYLTVIGRLRGGVTGEQATAELKMLVPALASRFPTITAELLQRSGARATVTSLKTATVAPVRAQLVLLGALVAVVLLIATTNVANLFLLRTERASQEIAIALSLGASRLALGQRFVVEGIVLGLTSTVVALPAAALALSTKLGFTEGEIPRLSEISFTPAAAALAIVCAGLIGGIVGLTALTRTGLRGLSDRLRASRSTPSRAWRGSQDALVAFQVAIALSLLVAAGLLGRSFSNLRNAQFGFAPENAMTVHVSLPFRRGYSTYAEHAAFHTKVMDRLAGLPGVSSVGAALRLPLNSGGAPAPVMQLQAGGGVEGPIVAALGNMASAEYFRAIRVPLRAGRSFQAGDLRGIPAVILSERLAASLFGTTAVIGRIVVRPEGAGAPPKAFTIVGVVGDVHDHRIEDGYASMAYFPLLRDGDGLPPDSSPAPFRPRDVDYVIRGTQLPSALTIQAVVNGLDRQVPATGVRSLGSLVDDATARVRLTMLLITIAGAAALLLGVIGMYSVVSYAAAGRVREFGIRLALGAAPQRVGSMVVKDGLTLVAIGTVGGLVAALAGTRFLRGLLYGVEPTSLAEFAMATALMVTASVLATAVPARRAARTDPAIVLRGD